MILVCPSCDTRYFTDSAAIGADGRRVRCASCGHSWFVKPSDEGAPVEEPEASGLTREQVERLRQTAAANSVARSGPHAEFRAREHSRRQRQRSTAAVFAWLTGFGVFAATAAGLVIFREDVVQAWPRTASFYKLAGLDVNRFGLSIADESARRSFDGTTPVLTVTANIVNESDEPREAPLVRISLRDEAGVELHAWTDMLEVASIEPGASIPFMSKIVAPPIETFTLFVTFTDVPGVPQQAEIIPADATQPVSVGDDAGENSTEEGDPDGEPLADDDPALNEDGETIPVSEDGGGHH